MAQDVEQVDPNTGEIMSMTESNQPLAVQLAQAELNQAVTTAKAFPRDIRRVVGNIMSLATLDEETAEEAVYALPRGGKPIKGPSIRFAEIVASQYGNCHIGSRVVDVDRFNKVVIAEGVFLDLETGLRRTAQIRRRIVDKNGRLFNDDMITVTGNAAASIAMREAILKGIPKVVWRKAYDHCERVIAGEVATLNVRREKAIAAFAVWGVKPEQIFAALEVESVDEITLDHLATLLSMHKAIKGGEQKVEDYFPAHSNAEKATEAARGTAAKLGQIAEQGQAKKEPKDNNAKGKKQERKKDEKGAEAQGSGKGKSSESSGEESSERGKSEGEDGSQSAEVGAGEPSSDDGDGGDGDGGDAGGNDNGGGSPDAPADDEVEVAFERGIEARKKGMSRKAVPPEYRAEGKQALADAWVRGHDEQNNAE